VAAKKAVPTGALAEAFPTLEAVPTPSMSSTSLALVSATPKSTLRPRAVAVTATPSSSSLATHTAAGAAARLAEHIRVASSMVDSLHTRTRESQQHATRIRAVASHQGRLFSIAMDTIAHHAHGAISSFMSHI
jgi:hypothetical protein